MNRLHSPDRVASGVVGGNLTAQVNIKSSDEIGDMARAYAEMQVYLQEAAGLAEQIGDGNLSR